MKKDITELFVFLDDFCQSVAQYLKSHAIEYGCKDRKPTRHCELQLSEIMTILLLYQQSPCKHFKFFYHSYLPLYRQEFPNLVSYNRFIELKSRALPYLLLLVEWFCDQSVKTGMAY